MPLRYHFLIVGCGFTGATLAERLATHGARVLVIDRRDHIGGNAYDRLDEHGIRVGPYGPHLFHTRSEKVWRYVNRFSTFNDYELRVQALHGGRFYDLPLNLSTFRAFFGKDLRAQDVPALLAELREPIEQPRNAEEAIVSQVGRELYRAFYEGYTRKQWGMEPRELDASVTLRLPIRHHEDNRYFSDRWQGLPSEGYTRLFERMLARDNITVLLNADDRAVRASERFDKLIYTGPIDAYFDHALGRLPYRSIDFRLESVAESRVGSARGIAELPRSREYTRSAEYRHFYRQHSDWTTLGRDYPCWNDAEPYYPVPIPRTARCRALQGPRGGRDRHPVLWPARHLQVLQHGPVHRAGADTGRAVAARRLRPLSGYGFLFIVAACELPGTDKGFDEQSRKDLPDRLQQVRHHHPAPVLQ